MKRLLILLLFLFLLVGCNPTNNEDPPINNDHDTPPIIDDNDNQGDEPIMAESCTTSNEIISLSSTATLNAETLWNHSVSCNGLTLVDNTIQYKEGNTFGMLKTGVFELPEFVELVPSWNIIIDKDVQVRIRVIPSNDTTSESILMAYWTQQYKLSFNNQQTDHARVSIDTLIATTSLQYVSFEIEFEEGNFALKNFSLTTKRDNDPFVLDKTLLQEVSIEVPAMQQLSIPVIGNSICSPTSVAMVLSYFDQVITPADNASSVFDEGAKIYGNWSFNASIAGEYEGLYSRVEYIRDTTTLLSYLQSGTPVVLSIKTTSQDDLTGSIMGYPAGHLIVLTGFTYNESEWYALVNDPAEYVDENVPREYPIDQLISAWRGYAYIIQNRSFN
jgi:hypothetical protein